MKIRETRKMTASALRALCITNDWYTRGTNEAYNVLLTNARECEMNVEALKLMAEDIIEHSAPARFADCEVNGTTPLEYVMYELCELCHSTFEIVR